VASKGIIVGFNADAETGARRLAELEGISIRRYDVIYSLVDDVKKALKGMLAPVKVEVVQGRADLRAVFPAGKGSRVAGIYVVEGRVTRGDSVRVLRQNKVVSESAIVSLRRFKDDVREVAAGYEAGLILKDFHDYQPGDAFQFFRIEETL
jgi:translation initiation factor IF-2